MAEETVSKPINEEPLSKDHSGQDELDVLLSFDGDENELFDSTPPTEETEKEPEKPVPQSPVTMATDDLPELVGENFPKSYLRMVERIKIQYRLLPSLNYDAIYEEFKVLSVPSVSTPTLQVINDQLHRVQAAKDRLAEIYIDVLKCYTLKKRSVDILQDAWMRFTEEKSADRRKADAIFRINEFLLDFASTESVLKASMHILKNLDSLHENLSRRITIWQLQLKLGDVGRNALPEIDYDATITDGCLTEDVKVSKDPTVGTTPEELNF